eukprot:4151333-Amphidinium_carterae.1
MDRPMKLQITFDVLMSGEDFITFRLNEARSMNDVCSKVTIDYPEHAVGSDKQWTFLIKMTLTSLVLHSPPCSGCKKSFNSLCRSCHAKVRDLVDPY